ncbi:MAG: AMP-binding protein [Proteobacteria bacterium]|nr:AMP-binding protein [Pseudomonadota bacterium]
MNVAARLQQVASANGSKDALVRGNEVVYWTALDARAGGFAHDLTEAGLGRGDCITIACGDPLETVIALIGGLLAGCTVAPINPRLTDDERNQILDQLSPDQVVTGVPVREEFFDAVAIAEEDPAIILFTSGSTGAPKGVVLSHHAVNAGLDIWIEGALQTTPDDVVLSVLPLGHSYGLFGSVLSPLLSGACTVLLPRFEIEEVLKTISRRRVTIFPGVATMFRRLLDSDALRHADLSSLRYVMTGAAPCPWDVAQAWKTATNTRIVRGYGMSELFRPISYAPDNLPEVPEAIGRALPGVELMIVDDDEAPIGNGPGELWVRTPACMTEYVGRPEETEAVLQDGWFKTGDIAIMTPDGLVCLVGRKKDIILRGGYNIVPGEIEAVLASHPDVAEAAVIGVPSRDMGEEVAAFVVLKKGSSISEAALIAYCRDQLAVYKYPRILEFLTDLPMGPTGKVDKSELAKQAKGNVRRSE